MIAKTTLVYLYILFHCVSCDYWSEREAIIDLEDSRAVGGDVWLNGKEEIVNRYLMSLKLKEFDEGFNNPSAFLPSQHFFQSRPGIEKSKVFQFIRGVPKGGALHSHSTALLSFEGLYQLTYEDNLYVCTTNGKLKMKFMSEPVEDRYCKWDSLEYLRRTNTSYDEWLLSQLTLVTDNPRADYQNIDVVWNKLNDIFASLYGMITYRPLFEKYLYGALQELYDDNVVYTEIRSSLPQIYELNGTVYDPSETMEIFRNVAEDFQRDHSDFLGMRLIYAPLRNVDNKTIEQYVSIVNTLKQRFPDFLVGFDFVGQEDRGRPLHDFLSQIEKVSKDINFFLHAGETNWHGTASDFNLVDAVLLGTKRIGHGFSIIKHPLIMKLAKERDIAIEVCPISNQVLMLVDDLRNHPATFLIANGYPVVIGHDDPTFWGCKALSYDFYAAFMGLASRSADLRLIKKLSENSLRYSALSDIEKYLAIEKWRTSWDVFIDLTYHKLLNENV